MISYELILSMLKENIDKQDVIQNTMNTLGPKRTSILKQIESTKNIYHTYREQLDKQANSKQFNFFFNSKEKKQMLLHQEMLAEYDASVDYTASELKLALIDRKLRLCLIALEPIKNSRNEYERTLQDSNIYATKHNVTSYNDLHKRDERSGKSTEQINEINTLVSNGHAALSITDDILALLKEAKNWALADTLKKKSYVSARSKQYYLKQAQLKIEQLERALQKFNSDIFGIHISANIQVELKGFLSIADFSIDRRGIDWAIVDEIKDSEVKMNAIKTQIQTAINKLKVINQNNAAQTTYDFNNDIPIGSSERINLLIKNYIELIQTEVNAVGLVDNTSSSVLNDLSDFMLWLSIKNYKCEIPIESAQAVIKFCGTKLEGNPLYQFNGENYVSSYTDQVPASFKLLVNCHNEIYRTNQNCINSVSLAIVMLKLLGLEYLYWNNKNICFPLQYPNNQVPGADLIGYLDVLTTYAEEHSLHK